MLVKIYKPGRKLTIDNKKIIIIVGIGIIALIIACWYFASSRVFNDGAGTDKIREHI
jgi:plastocyanin domain-containing protein